MKGHSRIYLAGKVTGLKPKAVTIKFNRAKRFLKKQGFDEVISPPDYIDPTASWTDAMIRLIPLLSTCNYFAILPDYETSNGAMTELYFARGMESEGKIKAIIHIQIPSKK